jgi:predicted phage tail protein
LLAPPDVTPSVRVLAGATRSVSEPELMKSGPGLAEGVDMRAIQGCLGALLICAAFWVVVLAWSMGWL